MLQRTLCFLSLVSNSSLSFASGELNKLLDVKKRAAPVRHDELRHFLSKTVTPVLAGTSLDRRHDTRAMRRMLGQLVRDAAFSANVLRANPDARFVRTLVDCIIHDGTRMHFIPQMSSAQASKTIEFLCKVGVRDPLVYPPLVSKLDFYNLKEMARVTFAFAEAQLHEQNINVVVPLYCGEKWSVAYDVPDGAPRRTENAGCNVFEAVRVLRAVSKSTRALVEHRRQANSRRGGEAAPPHSLSPIPLESIAQLREQLLLFLFENESVLRGAHWINTARALVHFPEETQRISPHLMSGGSSGTLAQQMSDVVGAPRRFLSATSATASDSDAPLTCSDVALLCVQKVYDFAEGRRADCPTPVKAPQGDGVAPFDLTELDMVKLVPLLRQVPSTEEVRRRRFRVVFDTISHNLASMQFGGLVLLIHTLRQLEGSQEFTGDAVQRIAIEAGSRLSAAPPAQVLAQVPFPRIVQFAAQLNAFRVTRCPGFVTFMEKGARSLPPVMNPDTVATLLNALTTVTGKGGAAVNKDVKAAVLTMVDSVVRYANSKTRAVPARREVEDSLFFQYPLPCTRILRAMVLLDVRPTQDIIFTMFGARGDAQLNSVLLHGGALLPFDLSRSLSHFCRQARAGAGVLSDTTTNLATLPAASRDADTGRSIEELLWMRGVLHTLVPLVVHHTELLSQRYTHTSGSHVPSSSYVPVCWRSTLECAAIYVDVTLDVTRSFDQMAMRLLELSEPIRQMAPEVLGVMATQCASLRETSRSPAELDQAFSKLHFSSNAIVHAFSFVLVWEYLLFQAAWEASRALRTSGPHSPSDTTRELAEQVTSLKSDYVTFLHTPLAQAARRDMRQCTPMDVMALAFTAAAANVPANVKNEQFPDVAGKPLLHKSDVLEITTHLPFAISLVMKPGPVNEFFSEKCVPLILEASP